MELNWQNNGAEDNGTPFPVLSRSTAPILKEQDNSEEDSGVFPGKGYGERELIDDDRKENVDVEVAAQNTYNPIPALKINSLRQDGTDQRMKDDTSSVESFAELPTGLNSEVDSSEESKSDTACASVRKAFYTLRHTNDRPKFIFPCTSDDAAHKDFLVLSTNKKDKKIRSPVHEEHKRLCHTQPSDFQDENTESARQTSRTKEKYIYDTNLTLQIPSQLIDVPVPIQGSHTSTMTSSTCTVDSLTIISLQLLLVPAIMRYFNDSQHKIYNYVIPKLFELFTKKDFDAIRLEWAQLLDPELLEHELPSPESYRNFNFYGKDRDIILDPFKGISNIYINQPTDTPIPSGLWRIQACVELVRPPEGRLTLQILENLLQEAFYQETRENADPIVLEDQKGSPPPLIICDLTKAKLNLVLVESLNGSINIGPYSYFVGGFTSLFKGHYTARIYSWSTYRNGPHKLYHDEMSAFTYDNTVGLLLEVLYQSGDISLIFLFRYPPE